MDNVLKASVSQPITWVELKDDTYIPSSSFREYIGLEDESELNSIDWKKLDFVQRDMHQKQQPPRSNEVYFHPVHGYLKLDKPTTDEQTIWNAELLFKEDGKDQCDNVDVKAEELTQTITLSIKI